MTIKLTTAAQENVNETSTDVAADVYALRAGKHTRESLLAHCLDGADEDRVHGWREYVDAIVLAAAKPAAKPKTIKITLSERRPVTIVARDWPIIASVESHDGKVFVQANTEWAIEVREHADGRRIVYGWRQAGGGGQYAGWRGADGGFIVDAADGKPNEDETIRAIRRMGGIIGRDDLAAECIGELPAEAI